MNETKLRGRLLTILLRRGQTNVDVDVFELAASCRSSVYAVLKTLAELDGRGLVDARRLRLTLDGLALASALAGARAAEARGKLGQPPPERKSGRSVTAARHAA
jgi:hypothetical protein